MNEYWTARSCRAGWCACCIADNAKFGQRLSGAAENATIYFTAGTYRDLQVQPKIGQTYVGQKGATLASERLLYAFECFDRPVDSVKIRNLTIDGYAPPYQCGAIQAGVIGKCGRYWNVVNCEIRNSATGGVVLFDYSLISGSSIHHCGQIGFKMFGQSPAIYKSEIVYNNPHRKFDVYDEAGGCKFWATAGAAIEDNQFHHNVGCGIWCDNDNHDGVIRDNECSDNTLAGIYQEIGGPMLIEGNTCVNNGTGYNQPGWLHGAGISIEASAGVLVRNNTISNCANGIGLIATERGNAKWQIKDVMVCDNRVAMNRGATGICWDGTCPAPWSGATFRNNKYEIKSAGFLWRGNPLSLEQWKKAGQD